MWQSEIDALLLSPRHRGFVAFAAPVTRDLVQNRTHQNQRGLMPSELLCVEDFLAQMSVAEQDEALAEARGASPLEDSVSERQAAAPVIVAPLPTPAEEAIAIAKVLREMLEDNSVSASHKAEFSEWAMEQLHLRQLHLPPGLRTAHVMNVSLRYRRSACDCRCRVRRVRPLYRGREGGGQQREGGGHARRTAKVGWP